MENMTKSCLPNWTSFWPFVHSQLKFLGQFDVFFLYRNILADHSPVYSAHLAISCKCNTN